MLIDQSIFTFLYFFIIITFSGSDSVFFKGNNTKLKFFIKIYGWDYISVPVLLAIFFTVPVHRKKVFLIESLKSNQPYNKIQRSYRKIIPKYEKYLSLCQKISIIPVKFIFRFRFFYRFFFFLRFRYIKQIICFGFYWTFYRRFQV